LRFCVVVRKKHVDVFFIFKVKKSQRTPNLCVSQ
jgi:hypothetical protein